MAPTCLPTVFSFDSMPSSPVTSPSELAAEVFGEDAMAESPRNATSRSSSTSPSVQDSNTADVQTIGTKRTAEALMQYTGLISRRTRLKPSGHQELESFSRLSSAHRDVWIAAQLVKLNERLDNIQPADAQWSLSKTLADKIEHFVFAVLISPTLSAYLENMGPIKLVLSILERHPSWGYTKDVKNDKYKADIVTKRVRDRLTERRSEIKQILLLSLGPEMQPNTEVISKRNRPVKKDIYQVCLAITAKHPASEVIITIQMCARFAFLRAVLVQLVKNSNLEFGHYWTFVDTQLASLRQTYPNEAKKITRAFMKVLEDDQKEFGETDLLPVSEEDALCPNREQRVADSASIGTFLTEDDY